MYRKDYIAKAERQLSNENYYEKLLETPHENFKKDMHDTISENQDKCAQQGFENFNLSMKTEHLNSIFCLRDIKPTIPIYL